MSIYKRIFSFVLAVVMAAGMLPVNTAAAEAAVAADGVSLEGSDSLGNLISQEIQAQQDAQASANADYEAGFSVTDLQFSGATARVTFDTREEATLVVAVYTEDGMTLLNSAYTQVKPGQTVAEVTLSGEMPRYFAAAAFLLNSYDLSPLCPAYDTPVYTQSLQDLLASTVEDYPADRVLNLDADTTTNFAVYAQDTLAIPEQPGVNNVLSADEETMTYVIGNADAHFTSLQEGDVVVYPYGDDQYLIAKVAELSVSGSTVTISGGELEMEDVFSHVKLEGTGDSGEAVVDDSTASPGVTYAGSASPAELTRSAEDDPFEGTVSKKIPFIIREGVFNGNLTLGIAANFSFLKSPDRLYIKLAMDTTIDLDANVEGAFGSDPNNPTRLGRIEIPFAWGSMSFVCQPRVEIKVSGKIAFTASISATNGFVYDSNAGMSKIQTEPVMQLAVSAEATVFLGLDLHPKVVALKGVLVDIDASMPLGWECSCVQSVDAEFGPGAETSEESSHHECKVCFALEPSVKYEFNVGIEVIKTLKKQWNVIGVNIPLKERYYSADYEEYGVGKCPHQSFRVTFFVKNSDGQPIPRAKVEVSGQDTLSLTNRNGICSYYLEPGSYQVQVVSGDRHRRITLDVEESRTVTVVLQEDPEDPEPDPPGGMLGGGSTPPVVSYGSPLFSGVFGAGNTLRWEFYPAKYELTPEGSYINFEGGTLRIAGSGCIDSTPWSGYIYYNNYGNDCKLYFDDYADTLVLEGNITDIALNNAGNSLLSHNNFRKISIPATMTRIPDRAFSASYKLEELVIPEGVTHIGDYAFAGYAPYPGNAPLKKVTLPDSLVSIGDGAFYSSVCLTEITIPGAASIGEAAFYQTGLRKVYIKEGVKELGAHCFQYSDQLTSVHLPDSLEVIGDSAFGGCYKLTALKLPKNLKIIGENAFSNLNLTNIVIPDNVTTIGLGAFCWCESLEEVTLGESVERIGNAAFDGTAITEIVLPPSVKYLENSAFGSCQSLEAVYFQGDPPAVEAYCFYTGSTSEDHPLKFYYPADNPLWTPEVFHSLSEERYTLWIPCTYDAFGNPVPEEEKAYDPSENPLAAACADGEDVPEETDLHEYEETLPAVTEPEETLPEVTKPEETLPEETESAETLPAETETLPEETGSFGSVAVTVPAGANTFRVGSSRFAVRSMASEEAVNVETVTIPALEALYGGDYSRQVTQNKTVKTVSFSGLVPGKDYLLLALTTLDTRDPLSMDSLIHIDQGTASEQGTLCLQYVERKDFSISYVMVSGPSGKDLKDAVITFPRAYASEDAQIIHPTVSYEGKTLTEGVDYVLSGEEIFSHAGTYTCCIRGIYDYTGTVVCSYTVAELPDCSHSFGAWEETLAPACEIQGEETRTCSICAAVETKPLPALGHELVSEVITAPTCTEPGYRGSADCSRCDYTEAGGEIPALGHREVIDEEIAATCTTDGITQGKHCETCGEILAAQEAIPAFGHVFADGFCVFCGAAGQADYELFSGKTMTLKVINPETDKAYTAKQITFSMDAEYDAFATLTKAGKLTAKKVFALTRIEILATVNATGEEIPVTVDIYPTLTQLELQVGNALAANNASIPMDFTDEPITLQVNAYPEDTLEMVQWSISDKKGQYARYSVEGDRLIISDPTGKAGTVTVKATVNAGVKKTVTVKLQLGSYARTVEIEAPETTIIRGGQSLKLKAAVTDPENVTKSGVVWTVSDKSVATISNGTLKAKSLTYPAAVRVTATSRDGQASDSIDIHILPKKDGQPMLMHEGQFVTGKTLSVNTGDQCQLEACTIVNGRIIRQEVTWSSAKPTIAQVDEQGLITALKPGTAKITATAGKLTASVTVKVTTLVSAMTLTTRDGKNLIEEEGQTMVILPSGKSATLTAEIQPKGASKSVSWEIVEGNHAVKITSSGKITANKDQTQVSYAVVRATAKDGSSCCGEIRVKVVPVSQGVQIYESGIRVRSNTVYVSDLKTNPVIRLSTRVYPAQALQDVTLTSSNKKVAFFNPFGELVCIGTGSTTITATAADGSKQKSTFKLTVVNLVTDLSLKAGLPVDTGRNLFIAGGKSLKLAAMVDIRPGNATNKKLTWSVSPNDAGVKINFDGVLSAGKVKEPVTVNVMVLTQDGSGEMLSFNVTVYPATTKISLMHSERDVTGKVLSLKEKESISLAALCIPENAAGVYTWSSSDEDYVQVDDNGTVTAICSGKEVTITCKASDGSGKKATVKIKVG